MVKEHFLRHCRALTQGEQLERLVFLGRQVHALTPDFGCLRPEFYAQFAGLNDERRGGSPAPSQEFLTHSSRAFALTFHWYALSQQRIPDVDGYWRVHFMVVTLNALSKWQHSLFDEVTGHSPLTIRVEHGRYRFDRRLFVFETALILDHHILTVRCAW